MQDFGALSIVSLLMFGVLLLAGYLAKVITPPLPASVNRLFFPALGLIVVYVMGLISGGITSSALTIVSQLSLLMIFFFAMVTIKWSGSALQIFAIGSSVFVFCNLLFWIHAGGPALFSSYMAHKNSLGGFLFGLFFFIFSAFFYSRGPTRFFWYMAIIAGIFLLYATNSRASWLASLVVLTTFFLWSVITKTAIRFKLFFFGIVCLLVVVTLVYPYMARVEELDRFRELVQLYTGSALFTGRDRLWPVLLDIISMHPFIGHGSGALPRDFMPTTLSAHNIYLQIALQVGLLGLFLFIFFFYRLWTLFWEARHDPVVRLSAAYLVGIMIHQLFDISLTQNNMSLGMLQWLILAIGVGRAVGGYNCSPPENIRQRKPFFWFDNFSSEK